MSNELTMRARTLSGALQAFHKALISAEAGDDQRLANPYTLLFATINDPRFAWVRPLGQLIVDLDEMAADEAFTATHMEAFEERAASFIGLGKNEDPLFRLNYLMAVQKLPDVGLSAGRLRKMLPAKVKPVAA